MKPPFFIAALVALSACSAAALAAPEPAPAAPALAAAPAPAAAVAEAPRAPAFSCRIEAVRSVGSVAIAPKVQGRAGFQGVYDFTLRTTGANSSEVSQGGPFSLAHDGELALGTNEIGLGRGDRLRATLTIRDANGIACRDAIVL